MAGSSDDTPEDRTLRVMARWRQTGRVLVEALPYILQYDQKTIVVKVERRFIHPVMGKTVRRSKKYHAHDEKGEFKIGDVVRIQECRPLSKLKTWEVLERVGK